METVLLDTDVFSFLLKGREQAELYRKHVEGRMIALTFVTVGELYAGMIKAKWMQASVIQCEQRIKATVVLPYDVGVCKAYAEIKNELRHDPIAPNDLWIASCARRYSVPLVTHNRNHFDRVRNLTVISEAPHVERASVSAPGETVAAPLGSHGALATEEATP
jgi:predicted nucleic acid-binding protein